MVIKLNGCPMCESPDIQPHSTAMGKPFLEGDLGSHTESKDCPCIPEVEVMGDTLLIIHNSWDHREIVEQAISIMNGEDDDSE